MAITSTYPDQVRLLARKWRAAGLADLSEEEAAARIDSGEDLTAAFSARLLREEAEERARLSELQSRHRDFEKLEKEVRGSRE